MIFAYGEVPLTEACSSFCRGCQPVIAADGVDPFAAVGLEQGMLIGDLDSVYSETGGFKTRLPDASALLSVV
jgi:thiamine pyrophosphokinase